MDLVPRDAHWQLSYPERTVGILKDMLDAMVRSFPDADPSELLGRCLAAMNDMLKTPGGASPFQRLFARIPADYAGHRAGTREPSAAHGRGLRGG